MANTGQRRHRRYEVHDVHGALLFRTQVKVRNLSVSGLALETPERLQLGRTYAIRLAGDHDAVDVSGTIRWCRLASARPAAGGAPRAVYEAGLAFEGVFSDMAKGLLGFLEHHVVLSPHQRLTGRFRAQALRPAELEARLAGTGGAPEPLREAIPFERRASEPGKTRFRLKPGAAGLTPTMTPSLPGIPNGKQRRSQPSLAGKRE